MKPKRLKPVRCSEAAKYVCENLDEHLNSRKCQQIKRHLEVCQTCTKSLSELKKIISFYKKSLVPKPQSDINKRLAEMLYRKP